MFPWLFFWSPQLNFPWSGAVRQRFELAPFFEAIPREAGDGAIEAEAFAAASYGRQLGVLTEVVLSLAEPGLLSREEADHALAQLRAIRQTVEAAKQRVRHADYKAAEVALSQLGARDEAGLRQLLSEAASKP